MCSISKWICIANDMMILVEQARYGLALIVAYQCCGCDQRISFCTSTKVTSPEGNKYWSCNLAAMWGQLATGGGFNKLEESISVLGVPVMSRRVFVNTKHYYNRKVVVEATGGINASCW